MRLTLHLLCIHPVLLQLYPYAVKMYRSCQVTNAQVQLTFVPPLQQRDKSRYMGSPRLIFRNSYRNTFPLFQENNLLFRWSKCNGFYARCKSFIDGVKNSPRAVSLRPSVSSLLSALSDEDNTHT